MLRKARVCCGRLEETGCDLLCSDSMGNVSGKCQGNVNDEMLANHLKLMYNTSCALAQWLSWLERRPVTAEVTGSSPVWVVLFFIFKGVLSFAGMAELADARDLKSRG